MAKMIEETKGSKFRKWLVEAKYTLQRGYGWMNVPLLGIIAASTLKAAFPGLVNSFGKFVALSIIGFLGLYFIGYLDKRYRFLHEENNYTIEMNPYMMKVVKNAEVQNVSPQ
jgi:hypothetical protein